MRDKVRSADATVARDAGGRLRLPTEMDWARPEYPRNQVDRAGVTILTGPSVENAKGYFHAIDVINNWRSAHSYPLNSFQLNLRQRARKIDSSANISQRLKRFESIVTKLGRDQTSTLELSQMQDIAGCRAVLSTVPDLYRLVRSYQRGTTGKWLHTLVGAGKDYVQSPKRDGYRSVHLIFRYVGTPVNNSWDKLRVEMQIRSQYQHAWATALEAVDIFTKQALKANRGDQNWQRFFALMASVIAIRERMPLVPGTPESETELRDELRTLARDLDAVNRLEYFRHAIREAQGNSQSRSAAYYLLHLSLNERSIRWDTFKWNESQKANAEYTKLEQEHSNDPDQHVVLVKAGSFSAMKRAYPSFFLDAELFLSLLGSALDPSFPLSHAA